MHLTSLFPHIKLPTFCGLEALNFVPSCVFDAVGVMACLGKASFGNFPFFCKIESHYLTLFLYIELSTFFGWAALEFCTLVLGSECVRFFRQPTMLKEGSALPAPDALMRQLIEIANSENPPCSNCDKRDRSNMYYCNTCGELTHAVPLDHLLYDFSAWFFRLVFSWLSFCLLKLP